MKLNFNLKKSNKEIQTTLTWELLNKGKEYNRLQNLYLHSRENWNYFLGKQWEQLKKPSGVSAPITFNIVKPIVKYKVNIINTNSYQIVFNPNSYNTETELKALKQVSKGLSQFVNKMWEKSQTGKKARSIVKRACIESEGILHFFVNEKGNSIDSELIDKSTIYYGNENQQDIQKQPYIIIEQRLTVEEVKERARRFKELGFNNLSDEDINNIAADINYQEQENPDKMTMEVSPSCSLAIMFKRIDGIVHVSESTLSYDILLPKSLETENYPLAHFIWEEEPNNSRGISEVIELIDNQNEINKTATRRSIATAIGAYPKAVASEELIENPEAIEQVGSTVYVDGMRADDVRKALTYLPGTQISPDAAMLQQDLISTTKDLSGANDVATGNVDPTQASGKAIIAVINATKEPMNDQKENYKYFIEDCANVILEMIKVNFIDGITLYDYEEIINDLGQTERIEKPYKISQEQLNQLDLDLKIDVTPKGPYDKLAAEMSLENLLARGIISLEEYADALPEDSSMPKPTLDEIIRKRKEARNRIAEIQQKADILNSAINQTMIEEGGDTNVMSTMPTGDESGISPEQQVSE